MELEAAKMIGAGLAAIALAGAGVGIGLIFGKINFESTINSNPNAIISQNICDNQNSGLSCGIPLLSELSTNPIKRKFRNIRWKNNLNNIN